MAAVPNGCATDAKPEAPGCTIHFSQSASDPPSPLSGTASSPGKISLVESELCLHMSKQSRGQLWDEQIQGMGD
ncbi:hypothetical protein TRAPUB_9766 [Trametes pubescens]|uniref:Uncharacterized protein n=1 Tax=Trametes pubescens TaxID=154538 RepID=A0A1M2W1D4_TRAPU|nr:hypothetical protein TRAPUB_9766 [Trametes pubescens]